MDNSTKSMLYALERGAENDLRKRVERLERLMVSLGIQTDKDEYESEFANDIDLNSSIDDSIGGYIRWIDNNGVVHGDIRGTSTDVLGERIIGIRTYSDDTKTIGAALYINALGYISFVGNLSQPTWTSGSHFRSFNKFMGNDTATSFTPSIAAGILYFGSSVDATTYAFLFYNTVTGGIVVYTSGANIETTTGVLSGTTGTDTKMTISCHTDGNIYVENRRGGSRAVYFIIG